MLARRTYLEMLSAASLSPARVPATAVDIARESTCPIALYRTLYLSVGAQHHWTDRAAWTDEQIAAHLAQREISIFVARIGGDVAGYFELKQCDDDSVEIAYFGLMPAFIGQGLGGPLLTTAVREAWTLAPTRVWLHTSSLDHPSALANYQRRGFTITRVEEYETA